MRKLRLALIAVALFSTMPAAATVAWAHGGQYRGPAGEVPPDSRQPQDPPPPDNGGQTPTPPDNGGNTPTDPERPGTPTPPDGPGTPDKPQDGGPTPPSGPSGPGSTSPRPSTHRATSFDSWRFWWRYNEDDILATLLRRARAGSGGDIGTMAGADGAAGVQTLAARALESEVVPLLRRYAEDSNVNFDIQSAAVLGLARMGRREMIPLLTRMARNQGDDHYNSVVEESAALALGILQDRSPEVKRFLAGVASDPTAKRRTRCFAAFGLGLLGESGQRAGYAAESYAALRSLVASPAESDRDVARSALVGIGLLRDPMAVADLREWLESGSAGSRKLDDLELSYVAAALGKIGIPGDGALAALRGQILRKNRMTRYSSVIALGQIAPRADEDTQADCVRTLANVVKCEGKATSDPQTVNFALASLGRIAASTAHDGVRDRALEVLGSCFAEGKSSRSFAALGLGFALFEKSPALRTSWAEKILYALDRSTGDVEQRGALCIALGLLRDVRSASSLRNILRDRGIDRPLRGTAALALGLLGDRDSREDVREALLEKGNVEMRVDAAMAAVLLQDGAAVDSMIDVLRDPKSSQLLRGSVAGALGRIGDRRALRPLAELLGDGNAPDLTRALACVALGQIGDREDVPVLADISRDVNYRAGYDAISEVLTIL